MFNIERQQEIMRILALRKSATVHRLAQETYASESTVRRDLSELEKQGKVRRTFGGVVLSETNDRQVPWLLRSSQNNAAKREIAARAKDFLSDGKLIFLDASSTVSFLVPYIGELSSVTVVTNSPNASVELGRLGVKNYCTGGLLLDSSLAYVGSFAEQFVSRFHADMMFFSSRGMTDEGEVTDSSVDETRVREAMMSRSSKKILLMDKTKLGKRYMCTLCRADELDAVIIDD